MSLERQQHQSAPRRILIVEDNAFSLTIIRDLLDYHGYTTIATGLGRQAVDLAIDQHPDLILLDMQLPDISGIDVARRLKADERTRMIPIIAVTAFAMPGDRARIIESGCDEYISKPIRLTEVLELIARPR